MVADGFFPLQTSNAGVVATLISCLNSGSNSWCL